jgi:molybdopterin synthase sulfur carrier subunit
MLETTAMQPVTIRYWAGARAAAGVEAETVEADTVRAALEAVSERRSSPQFARVVRASAVLVAGTTAHPEDLDRVLEGPVDVEVLPPFAGGSLPIHVYESALMPANSHDFSGFVWCISRK